MELQCGYSYHINGCGHLEENIQEIMKYKDPQTPVCVIEKGTTPDERIITGTREHNPKEINPPALVIIGPVVDVFKAIQDNKLEDPV
jgi:uroporphyrin-III C-methyltransferase